MSSIFRPAHSSGRSNGVLASSLVVNTPEMSGSPHGVLGGTKPFTIRDAMKAFTLSVPVSPRRPLARSALRREGQIEIKMAAAPQRTNESGKS